MGRIVLLGTKGGPAVRKDGAMPSATLIEMGGRAVLVDAAVGVTRALVKAGVDLRDPPDIFITHLHSDHVLGLGPLLHTAWTTGLKRVVTVYGPPRLEGYLDGFMASMAVDCAIRVADEGRLALDSLIRFVPVCEGPIAGAPFAARALAVPHPPLDDCLAFRFDGPSIVTISGDTAYFPPLAEFASGSDVLVHEAILAAGIDALVARTGAGEKLRAHLHASHTEAADVGRIAAAAGAGHLVLNHLVPADDPAYGEADWAGRVRLHWSGALSVGYDGLEIALAG